MAAKKVKKDFDKEQMYSKIMPTLGAGGVRDAQEPSGEPPHREAQPRQANQPGYLLRNYMEDIVLEKLAHTMDMLKACECEKCKKDVMAIALNELPPSYMTLPPGEVEAAVRKLRSGVEVKVSATLIKAVQTVKANPAHTLER